MNNISPKALMQSKWTKVDVTNKEKHFIVTVVKFDEQQKVVECIVEAVMTKRTYSINWRDLKQPSIWLIGWK